MGRYEREDASSSSARPRAQRAPRRRRGRGGARHGEAGRRGDTPDRGRAGPATPGSSWPGRPDPPRGRRRREGCSRPVVQAAVAASAARTRSRTSRESEMLPRSSRTVTGVTAKAAAAVRPAPGARDAPDGAVEDEHRERTLRRPGGAPWPRCGSRRSATRAPEPRRRRQLVDGHRSPRVEGAEEEVVPALRHAAHSRRRRRSRALPRSCPTRRREWPGQRRPGARTAPRRAGRAETARTASFSGRSVGQGAGPPCPRRPARASRMVDAQPHHALTTQASPDPPTHRGIGRDARVRRDAGRGPLRPENEAIAGAEPCDPVGDADKPRGRERGDPGHAPNRHRARASRGPSSA